MPEWEYRKIDLNQYRPRGDELDLLNAAGADGWELVGIASNNMAYLNARWKKSRPRRIRTKLGRMRWQTRTMQGTEERRSR